MTKRKLLRIASFAVLTVGILTLAAAIVLPLLLPLLSASSPSLGIIGGADGPTMIVVATTTGIDWDIVIGILLTIVGTVGLIAAKRQK